MISDEDIAIFGQAPLFEHLDAAALKLLRYSADLRQMRSGDILFSKGDIADGGYVITRGSFALSSRDGFSAPFVAKVGALIGRNALFFRSTRPATAIAREPSAAIRISPSLMKRVLEEHPKAALLLRDYFAQDLAELQNGLSRARQTLMAIDDHRDVA